MKVFIVIMLLISGCAFVFDLIFSLYLSFSPKIKQEKYTGPKRKFDTLLLLIPAMNEYQPLSKNLPKFIELHNRCKDFIDLKIVIIDDDSNDGTTELLDRFSQEKNLFAVHRVKPNAQQGKGPALQEAVNRISNMNFSPKNTIIGVIDADSRFDCEYLKKVVAVFQNSSYDLVQTRVDIFNIATNLTIMQNFELSIYNALLQMARTTWGSALASGNGQFVTLKMAEDVGWSSSLLEDCEFSLKGLLKGYYGTFLNTEGIKQEGVTSIRKLIRQRTRWCQGGLQCFKIYSGKIIRSDQIPTVEKTFTLLFLMMPYLSVLIAPASIGSFLVLLYYAQFNFWTSFAMILTLMLIEYLTNILLIEKQRREANFKAIRNPFRISRIIFSFSFYRWMLAFIPYRSIARELIGNNSWVKTNHS